MRPQKTKEEIEADLVTAEELILRFIEYKSKFVSSSRSLKKYQTVLSKVGVEYRKPYNTRHTLISHALDRGMNPVEVAQLTGHDVQTLYENYAGNVNSRPMLPEIIL